MITIPENKTILVIDDDLSSRSLLLFLFRNRASLIFVNPEIEAIKEIHIKPDLIFLEFYTGKCDFELIRKVKALDFNVPIIATTACTMDCEREKSLQFGCDYFLPKPVNTKKLLALSLNLMSTNNEEIKYYIQKQGV